MSKISDKSARAFIQFRDFKIDNTRIISVKDITSCYLYGNLIAIYSIENGLRISDCGRRTRVTKSRLNAILTELNLPIIKQVKYEWYIDEKEMPHDTLFSVNKFLKGDFKC